MARKAGDVYYYEGHRITIIDPDITMKVVGRRVPGLLVRYDNGGGRKAPKDSARFVTEATFWRRKDLEGQILNERRELERMQAQLVEKLGGYREVQKEFIHKRMTEGQPCAQMTFSAEGLWRLHALVFGEPEPAASALDGLLAGRRDGED